PEGRRQAVTCLWRLARALLEACDRAGGAEQRLVEVADERTPVVVQENRDEQATQQLAGRLAQLRGEVGALRRGPAEQGGTTHRGGPGSVALPERCLERVAELLAAEGLRLEERQLPAVESVAEVRVVVGGAEADPHVACHRGAEGVETRRLARRSGRRDRQHRADPVRPPVEPFEQHRPRSDRSRGGEPDRGDRVRELAWSV